jgi:hypothetical protein
MKARPHAEMIKAWADGAEIQGRVVGTEVWRDYPDPAWVSDWEYRVKPVIAYPETGMTPDALALALQEAPAKSVALELRAVANAALRHAIDAGQVVIPTTAQAAEIGRQAAAENFPGGLTKWRECIAGFGPIDGVKEVVQAVKAVVEGREVRELAIAEAVRDAAVNRMVQAGYHPLTAQLVRELDPAQIISGVQS